MKDLTSDFESRYQYFYESAQSDITNIMKSQKDSNLSVEKFLDFLDERVNNFETTVNKRIEEAEMRYKELREESGGQEGASILRNFRTEFADLNRIVLKI